MATATAGSRKRTPTSSGFVFHDVSWDDYEAMLRIVGERPIRVTYDQGTMEIFMPSFGHDSDAYLLGRMVDMLTEELEISVEGGGTTTHKRQDLGKGSRAGQVLLVRGECPADARQAPARPEPRSRPRSDHRGRCDPHLARSAQDLRRDGGAGGLAIHRPVSPVPPSPGGWDLSGAADQPELSRSDRRVGRSIPQGGADRRSRRPGSGPSGPSSARRSFPVSGRMGDDPGRRVRLPAVTRPGYPPASDRPGQAGKPDLRQCGPARLTTGRHPHRSGRACDPAGRARGPAAAAVPAPGRRRARRWPGRAATRRACARWRR